MKNLTYHNLMIVIRKLQKKGWSFEESEKMARRIFAQFEACPMGMSIEAQINQIQTKEEWEAENR